MVSLIKWAKSSRRFWIGLITAIADTIGWRYHIPTEILGMWTGVGTALILSLTWQDVARGV